MALPTIQLAGTCVDEGALRFTAAGQAVYQVRVACNQRKRNQQGEWEDGDSVFLDVVVWGSPAETAAETFRRGSKIIATGTLKQESYETKNGEKRSILKMTADNIGPLFAHTGSATGAQNRPQRAVDARATDPDDPWATPPSEPPF